jgi:hypothetical protein
LQYRSHNANRNLEADLSALIRHRVSRASDDTIVRRLVREGNIKLDRPTRNRHLVMAGLVV